MKRKQKLNEGSSATHSDPPENHHEKKGKFVLEDELTKPPTMEEMNSLRETEIVYNSSLFRIQAADLVKEHKIKNKIKLLFQKWFLLLENAIKKIPAQASRKLIDQDWLQFTEVKIPILQEPFSTKGNFNFLPPSKIEIIGSYQLDLIVRPNCQIDVLIEIPKECWQHKDMINQCYYRKRALYLTVLASSLINENFIQEINYERFLDDHMRPVLVIKPKGDFGDILSVRLFPAPPEDFFAESKLLPNKNNVRKIWFFGNEYLAGNEPTPLYNNGILMDSMLSIAIEPLRNILLESIGVKEGIIMLKVWLKNRRLDQGFGFNGFLVTLFVSDLLKIKRINPLMSSYQVIKTFFAALVESDWSVKEGDSQNAFDVIYLLKSLNVTGGMLLSTYNRVKYEATKGLEMMNSSSPESFENLFMKPVPFNRYFDHLICLNVAPLLEKSKFKESSLDYCGDVISASKPKMLRLLTEGLGKRIELIDMERDNNLKWSLISKPAKLLTLKIGLLLDTEFSNNKLERGPLANGEGVDKFRQLWGDKSELRRFQDGTICEAVVFSAQTISERRLIVKEMVQDLLERHFGLTDMNYFVDEFDSLLSLKTNTLPGNDTGEERTLLALETFNSLSKELQTLQNIPLTINSVQGISPALRYTEVFPPFKNQGPRASLTKNDAIVLEASIFRPIEVIIRFEGSGKWPDDAEAIRRVIAAFLLEVSEALDARHLDSSVYPSYMDIVKDGFLFRLHIACGKELTLLRKATNVNSLEKLDISPAYIKLQYKTEFLPLIASYLHGLQQKHSIFGLSCRLAKRWISSQLLSDHISELCIELLVAHLFLSPEPFPLPKSSQVAFLRFLLLISDHNWQSTPLLVNLGDSFKPETVLEIQSWFFEERTNIPPMCIITPYDPRRSLVTQQSPRGPILVRLVQLARVSLIQLENQLNQTNKMDQKVFFRPPLNSYDIIIHLDPKEIPRSCQSVDYEFKTGLEPVEDYLSNQEILNTVGYEPVKFYIKELKAAFGEFALFFYDPYGGDLIGVIWNPQGFDPRYCRIWNVPGRHLNPSSTIDQPRLVPNVEGIIECFSLMGKGLVKSVQLNTDKWIVS